MKKSIEHELMVCVERCVRPIRASNLRKDRMRSELYAHLYGVCEEERSNAESEEAALEKTRQRFGDPANVRDELQNTVPWIERALCVPLDSSNSRWKRRPDESAIKYDCRIMLMTAAFSLVGYGAIVVLALVMRGGMRSPRALPGMIAAAVLACAAVPVFVLLNSAKREALRRIGQWKWAGVTSIAVSAVTSVVVLASVLAIMALMNWTSGVHAIELRNPYVIAGALIATPLFVEFQGRLSLTDTKRFEQWGCLEID